MVTGSDCLRMYSSNWTVIHGEGTDSEEENSDAEQETLEGQTLEESLEGDAEGDGEEKAKPEKRKSSASSLQRRQSRFVTEPWSLLWQCRLARPVHHLRFSPDGNFFASAGKVRVCAHA